MPPINAPIGSPPSVSTLWVLNYDVAHDIIRLSCLNNYHASMDRLLLIIIKGYSVYFFKPFTNDTKLLFQLNRVKAVEKEKDELEGSKNEAVEYLNMENSITKQRNVLFQKYM